MASSEARRNEVAGGETIQVVLTDFQLDGESGMELIRWVDQSFPALVRRRLIVSGEDPSTVEDELFRNKLGRLVTKPIDADVLLSKVARILEARR